MVNARRMGPETGFQPDSECPVRVRDGTLNLQPSGRPGSVDEKSATPLVRSRRDWRWVDRWKAAGAIWDEAAIATYVADPGAWVQAASGDASAKSKMSFKLSSGGEDMAAYLATLK